MGCSKGIVKLPLSTEKDYPAHPEEGDKEEK